MSTWNLSLSPDWVGHIPMLTASAGYPALALHITSSPSDALPCRSRPAGLFYSYTVHNMPLMSELKSHTEALTLAIYLSLIASTKDKSKEAAELADSLAQKVSAEELEACKAVALAQFQHDSAE